MRRVWLPPLASALAAFGYFLAGMAYPWQLALLAATAIGALVYSTQVTWRRMRRLTQSRPSHRPDERGGAAGGTPASKELEN